jgi:hypothetical protein
MREVRQHPRISDTADMQVSLRSPRKLLEFRRVLNLSQGGMLLAGGGLPVDEIARFELKVRNYRFAGIARIAHSTGAGSGLRFLSWQGPVEGLLRTLIASRSHTPSLSARANRHRDEPIIRRVAVLIGMNGGQRNALPRR